MRPPSARETPRSRCGPREPTHHVASAARTHAGVSVWLAGPPRACRGANDSTGSTRCSTPIAPQFTEAVSTTAIGASDSGGALGLNSLITLLLSLEGRFFVLTASSNWSILINELRRGRINLGCGGCTDMISLTPTKCMNGFEYLCVSLDL
jgi:hypothetical protein